MPSTTSTNSTTNLSKDRALSGWIPSEGRTTCIRSTSRGYYLSLVNGNVVLAPPYGGNTMKWTCVAVKGFLGFRSNASGKFLCHGDDGKLKCTAEEGGNSSHFTITPVSGQGFVIQALEWFTLMSVVIVEEGGKKTLARCGDKVDDGATWKFIETVGDGVE